MARTRTTWPKSSIMSRRKSPESRLGKIFRLLPRPVIPNLPRISSIVGAIAQLGERYNGIVEVMSSILIGSTIKTKGLAGDG